MPTTQQLRDRLLKKLRELFQLDQPDLDFGFYRIMHAKSKQIQEFLDKDLLKVVEDAFGQANDTRRAELQAAYEKAIQTAKEFGAANPEETEPVKKAKAALDALKDTISSEGEIYDHLYRFFERYYEDGDFISRRYYARETSGKASTYAIPYSGEEVKLHWANADQYYIKTAEYFSNFTFDLTQAAEIRALKPEERVLNSIPENPVKVHFRIIEATEGEHGNVRASEATKRYFIIHKEKPVEISAENELIINFEYRPDPEKTGQEGTWRAKRNNESLEIILAALADMIKQDSHLAIYDRLLKFPAPTESERNRPLLAKYVNQYTARNTMDYFIHKNLGGFLKRELDFYIKNEVMRLDDIENAEAPAVENYLAKIKVLRKIAGKLIDFLAQLEEFQKKLWLKKKFVVETNYCITLDRVPEEFYSEITANIAQHDEWIKLFAIDEIALDTTGNPGYSKPLTFEFLKANNKLVLDTWFFDDFFKSKLLASIENFDEQCDGLLIHSENFQALNLLKARYCRQVSCAYIDPPYNTGDSKILYKNDFDSASWLSLMQNRIDISQNFLDDDFVYFIAIDDYEMVPLCELIDTHFNFRREMIVINHHPQGGKAITIANTHEYMLALVNKFSDRKLIGRTISEDTEERPYKRSGTAASNFRKGRPNSFYSILVDKATKQIVGIEEPPEKESNYITADTTEGYKRVYPLGNNGSERVWRNSYETGKKLFEASKLKSSDNYTIYQLIEHGEKKTALFSNWVDTRYNAGTYGANLLNNILGIQNLFSYPKSLYTVEDALFTYQDSTDNLILDFFGGSGTTAHATINLNRQDDGSRKYILVEMGDYFNTALKPRITKIIYSTDWKDGKPTARETGISHCFKYIRLEAYEDTLNNLRFEESPVRDKAIQSKAELKEDYVLHYLLDVETRDSQSLLNIDAFADPTAYKLKVKKSGTDEYVVRNVDLMETFNYLIGLRVNHVAAPQEFAASFTRLADPEVPKEQKTKLVIDGKIQQVKVNQRKSEDLVWWFRKLEGWLPKDTANPDNGQREKVLVVWRKLTGDLEKDNVMLDEWFQKNRISTRDFEYDIIYVNGSNNLPNLMQEGDNWKVRLIEEEFMKRMWETAQ